MANEVTDPRVAAVAQKLKWGLGIAGVIAGGAVAVAYTASLVAIGVAGAATLVVVHGAPWASQKIANAFLNMRKADARADPVTNRERISGITWERLEATKKEIEALDAEVELWGKQIASLPPDEAKDFESDYAWAQECVGAQARAWKAAEEAAKKFDEVTAKVARKWRVAQTGMKIKQLSTKDKEARINDILATEAAESADRQLATAFSSLDNIIERGRASRPSLPHNPSPTLPTNVVDVQAKIARS